MFEKVFKKMNPDEYDQKYTSNVLSNSVCADNENLYSNLKIQMKNSIKSKNSSSFNTIFNNLAADSDGLGLNTSKSVDKKKNSFDDSYNSKDDLIEYMPIVTTETANHSNHYSRNNNEKIPDSTEQCGNTTSPKSVSSQCSNTTSTSASNSSPGNCNLNCENGSLLLAYSPPTSNTSASSGKSFTSTHECFTKIEGMRYDAMKNDASNLTPNGSRSPSSERMKMNGNMNDRKSDSRNLMKKDLIPQRKRRDFIPDELKDDHYWERRRKNNLAAKRSREKRRINDIVLEAKVFELKKFNNVLKLKLELLSKKYQVSEEEIERIFEENKHLLEVVESIEISELTSDSAHDTYVITETDTKENESQDEDSKMNMDNKRYTNKSSCSSNSSLNENSSGEEGTKRTKVEILKKKILSKPSINSQSKHIEPEKQNDISMLTDIQYFNEESKPVNHDLLESNSFSNGCHKSLKSSLLPDNDVVKNHYPLLYGQLCREICNTTDVVDSQMNETHTNNNYALDKMESIQLPKSTGNAFISNIINKTRPQSNLLFNQLKSNSSDSNNLLNNQTFNSIYDKNREALNESLLMKASSQQETKFSLSKLLLSKKFQEEKTLLMSQFSVNNNEYKNFNDGHNKDVINSLVNEYFQNKTKQNSLSLVENNSKNTDEDLLNAQMQKYKNLISRTNCMNEELKSKTIDSSSIQLHVNTLAYEKNNRTKKRHIQGELTSSFDKSISVPHIFNQEIISPSSSSDKSYDEYQNGLKHQKPNEDIEEFSYNNNYNENINFKFSNHAPILKSQQNVKIRKLNSKSPQNINAISYDDNKTLINCGAIESAGLIQNPTISIQEFLNFSNGSPSQQKLLMNGKYNNNSLGGLNSNNNNNNNNYATADNMPLKLRFKMLQLKTGEVN
jgi:hypothetical protein